MLKFDGWRGVAQANIVIVYADDLDYGDLGVQNPESKIPTPHLDQIQSIGDNRTRL